MKPFDFRKYLKNNPLLKESLNEKYSNWTNWQPGFEDFWDRVYDGAIEKAIEISKESGDDMNIEEISKAIENECANPNRVMQAFEADSEVDEAIDYVLDSLEIGEPMGVGKAKDSFIQANRDAVGMPGSKMYETGRLKEASAKEIIDKIKTSGQEILKKAEKFEDNIVTGLQKFLGLDIDKSKVIDYLRSNEYDFKKTDLGDALYSQYSKLPSRERVPFGVG